jgi:hypothetical protein
MKLFTELVWLREAKVPPKDKLIPKKNEALPTDDVTVSTASLAFVYKKANDAYMAADSEDHVLSMEAKSVYAKFGVKALDRLTVFRIDASHAKFKFLLKHLGITANASDETDGQMFIKRLRDAGFTSAGKYMKRKIYKRDSMLFIIDDTDAATPPVFYAKKDIVAENQGHDDDCDDCDDCDLDTLIDKYCDQERLYSFEGPSGIRKFTKLVGAIGYRSLDEFLEDNPGALDSMVEWLKSQNSNEWQDAVKAALHACK